MTYYIPRCEDHSDRAQLRPGVAAGMLEHSPLIKRHPGPRKRLADKQVYEPSNFVAIVLNCRIYPEFTIRVKPTFTSATFLLLAV